MNKSPFVYYRIVRKGNSATSGQVKYRLGGLEFPDRARAEMAARSVAEEIAKLEQTHLALRRVPGGDIILTSYSTGTNAASLTDPVFLMEKIRVIGETSARVFLQTGC